MRTMKEKDYAIITPAHNEAPFLALLIDSIAAQTHLPGRWIVLDDRSTDRTWSLLEEAGRRLPFLEPVRIPGAPGRRVGANVVHLFNEGYRRLPGDIPFVVKMDADITLNPDYFSLLLERFLSEPGLGIASGKTYTLEDQGWVLERIADTHVTGACKTYRRACLRQMGGLIPILGWDVLDVVQARARGWSARSFRDLPIHHYRVTGSAQGMRKANISYGRSYYAMRALPLFVLLKSLYRAMERPYGLGLFICWGYLKAALEKEERLADRDLARFLRKEQRERILGRNWEKEILLPKRLGDRSGSGPQSP